VRYHRRLVRSPLRSRVTLRIKPKRTAESIFSPKVLLPRAETGVERRGDHIRGDRFRQPERVWISACSRLSHPAGLSEIESGLF
jgi:hypothetical protein